MNAWQAMDVLKAEFAVTYMAEMLEVSRSGFYAWRARDRSQPSRAQARVAVLEAAIVKAHDDSAGVNGAPRITADLRADGHVVSQKTVAKIMQGLGIQGVSPRPFVVTTVTDGAAVLPDLVDRVFDTGDLNKVWISDITYLGTGQGWLYLAVVRDACSRRVIGWAIADHMHTDLVEAALQMAVDNRPDRPAEVVFHSDRGSQYTSDQIANFATDNGLLRSVGRTGVCWDNAMAESFFATLKVEYFYRHVWPTKAGAIEAIGTWIEKVYNRRRRHSAIGTISPIQFELQHAHQRTAAKAA